MTDRTIAEARKLGVAAALLLAGCSSGAPSSPLLPTDGENGGGGTVRAELDPSTASILAGGVTEFTLFAVTSSGTRSNTGAAWTATGGTITTGGLYTAGSVAGTFSVIARQSNGTLADTAVVTITSAPVAAGGVPELSGLPVASSTLAPNTGAYGALGVAARPAGWSYTDPTTNVRVWKASSPTLPAANSGTGHDYADGGNEASLGWGANGNTHTVLLKTSGGYYLVDFTRGAGFTNYRALTGRLAPQGDLQFSFSSNPATPRIAYVANNGALRRINTATMVEETTGNFPRTTGVGGGWWLQHDRTDTWFVGMPVPDASQGAWAWNSQTNAFRSRTSPYLNEPRLERDGRWVTLGGTDTYQWWDLQADTVGAGITRILTGSYGGWFAHNGNLRGFFTAGDPDRNSGGTIKRHEPPRTVGASGITDLLNPGDGNYGIYHSGNWVQSDADLGGDLRRQWVVVSPFATSGWASPTRWNRAVGYFRADGSDTRLLLHHYSGDNPTYFANPWAKPSPDGKIVIFTSNMLNSGRYDLFVAEVPLR